MSKSSGYDDFTTVDRLLAVFFFPVKIGVPPVKKIKESAREKLKVAVKFSRICVRETIFFAREKLKKMCP